MDMTNFGFTTVSLREPEKETIIKEDKEKATTLTHCRYIR